MTSMVATGPAMASMYAAPQTYVGAPTMTSMYATPGPSMYMPAAATATAVAAPTVVETVAAPTMVAAQTVAAPSYVAPQVVAAPVVETVVAGPQFGVPQPVSLTAGLVPPAKVEAERLAYEKALQAQLDKQSNAVLEEANIKKKMLEQTCKTQVEEFKLQIDENFKIACLRVDQEAETMLNGLKEAAITQQTAREEAAAIAVADYTKKKALEDMTMKSYNLQKQWFESETKLTQEYQKVMQAGARAVQTPAMPMVPAAGVV